MGKEQGAGQTWALGTVEGSPRQFEVVTDQGEKRDTPVEELADSGVLHTFLKKRLLWEGDLSQWQVGQASYYLKRLGFELPSGEDNRHQVLCAPADRSCVIHVPALVFMRAIFQPAPFLLPYMFTPTGIDQLSFVTYGEEPPDTVADGLAYIRHGLSQAERRSAEATLSWLQLSKSARAMAVSVFQNACEGELAFTVPKGDSRIAFEGVWREPICGPGRQFIATGARLQRVEVPAEDSLTGVGLTFDWRKGVQVRAGG